MKLWGYQCGNTTVNLKACSGTQEDFLRLEDHNFVLFSGEVKISKKSLMPLVLLRLQCHNQQILNEMPAHWRTDGKTDRDTGLAEASLYMKIFLNKKVIFLNIPINFANLFLKYFT